MRVFPIIDNITIFNEDSQIFLTNLKLMRKVLFHIDIPDVDLLLHKNILVN